MRNLTCGGARDRLGLAGRHRLATKTAARGANNGWDGPG